ncbi:papilin-like isoform x3 [Plakobranchus ocellatus]|uniref:Papilin-like isoform x3 n=1 Tax=Plakobranchus ocellatus TaxID=259542 RepID=A0AAV4AUZ1_9GAST|nr:papilin-like isoform x3 [Plakobranchus ocellatus]
MPGQVRYSVYHCSPKAGMNNYISSITQPTTACTRDFNMRILQITVLALVTAAAVAAPKKKREVVVPDIWVGGCAGTRYGCCPDGVTARYPPEANIACPSEGAGYVIHTEKKREVVVPDIWVGGCAGTRYGCCPDGVTARYPPEANIACPSEGAGYVIHTEKKREVVVPDIWVGGCAGTRYGCCPDGVTARYPPEANIACPSNGAGYVIHTGP